MPDIDPNLPPENAPAPKAGSTRYYSQEELDAERERVRTEERDKLYPTISKSDARSKAMEDELKELRSFQKKQEKTEAERLAAIDAERKKAADAELSAKELIERTRAEMDARLAQYEADQALKIAILEKENELSKLQAYIQRRVNEEQENIAPELIDLVDGDSVEAVEASIVRMTAKTDLLAQNFQQARTGQRAGMRGVSPSGGANATGPLDIPGDRGISDEDIKKMGMKEYRALREARGMDRTNNQGLFRA